MIFMQDLQMDFDRMIRQLHHIHQPSVKHSRPHWSQIIDLEVANGQSESFVGEQFSPRELLLQALFEQVVINLWQTTKKQNARGISLAKMNESLLLEFHAPKLCDSDPQSNEALPLNLDRGRQIFNIGAE